MLGLIKKQSLLKTTFQSIGWSPFTVKSVVAHSSAPHFQLQIFKFLIVWDLHFKSNFVLLSYKIFTQFESNIDNSKYSSSTQPGLGVLTLKVKNPHINLGLALRVYGSAAADSTKCGPCTHSLGKKTLRSGPTQFKAVVFKSLLCIPLTISILWSILPFLFYE